MPIGTPSPGVEPPTPGAAAAEFTYAWFGRPTATRRTRPLVGTTNVQVLANNPRRLGWSIENRAAGNVYVEITDPASATTSNILGPGGGFLEATVQEDGEAVAEAVNAIADVANSQLAVWEVIAV